MSEQRHIKVRDMGEEAHGHSGFLVCDNCGAVEGDENWDMGCDYFQNDQGQARSEAELSAPLCSQTSQPQQKDEI